MAGRRQISVRSISTDQAIILREAMTTYLRLYAPAEPEAQDVCEQFVAMIDEQLRGQESSGTDAVVTLSPTSAQMTADGTAQTFDVTLSGEGSWSASVADMWLHIDSPVGPQAASGTVTFSAQANNGAVGQPAADRVGIIQVNDAEFTVTQAPWDVLPVELAPTQASVAAEASSGNTFGVTITGSGTSGTWTVDTENAARPWLILTSPTTPQSVNGTVTFSVQANDLTTARTGKFFVNGQPFTVNQAAGVA